MIVRTIQRSERERVLELLAEWISADFFRRYFDHDPAFRDDLCLVAEEDDGRFVATLQIMPKTVRIDGRELRVGGIGNVFTTESYRHKRVASQLLTRAIERMEEERFDLSLLFASRLTFYGQFGWGGHRRLLAGITPPPEPTATASTTLRRFESGRDLDTVMRIYDSYSRALNGPVARDRRYWEGQLRYAGAPDETFLLAERSGEVAAYMRFVDLYGAYTVMEHAALSNGRDALLDLLGVAAERSRERGFFLFHLGAEPGLEAALTGRGFGVNEVEDVFWMWRVISPGAVAQKLGLTADAVEHADFFERILPYRGSVYWTSDRF